MSQQTEQITATRRTETGKRRMRRMREGGQIPAVIYGHGEETVVLAISADQFDAAMRHGSRVVDLKGDLDESALISEVQWDAFGVEPLHIDFIRVSKSEKVDITVPLELRGAAPGTSEGGVVTQSLHELEINCPAVAIPENIEVNINHLELDGEILAKELELPEGATLITDGDLVVAQCAEPTEIPEEEEVPGAEGAEPELVGKDDDEEGEGESED